MAKKLNPVCSVIGQRKEAMRRTWKELKELEEKGIPTVGKFGEIYRKNFQKVKEEGKKAMKEGKCYIEVEKK